MTRSSCLFLLLLFSSTICDATAHPMRSQQIEREEARKTLQLIASHLAGQRRIEPSINSPDVASKQLMGYLKQLSKGDELRLEAIALARKYASPSDLTRTRPDSNAGNHRLAHERLRFAWRVLMETGVLREGLSLEEAVAMLGPSRLVSGNKDGDYVVEWYYSSPMHVNPCLYVSFKAGRIEMIRVVNK